MEPRSRFPITFQTLPLLLHQKLFSGCRGNSFSSYLFALLYGEHAKQNTEDLLPRERRLQTTMQIQGPAVMTLGLIQHLINQDLINVQENHDCVLVRFYCQLDTF